MASVFDRLCEEQTELWHTIDASESQAVVFENIRLKAMEIIRQAKHEPLRLL